MVDWGGGELASARVMPCGYYADGKSGEFYELEGHVLVVWHGTGPRPVAVLPKAAVSKAKARRSGWAPRVPPVPVAAVAAAAAQEWPARGPLPSWASAAQAGPVKSL